MRLSDFRLMLNDFKTLLELKFNLFALKIADEKLYLARIISSEY